MGHEDDHLGQQEDPQGPRKVLESLREDIRDIMVVTWGMRKVSWGLKMLN